MSDLAGVMKKSLRRGAVTTKRGVGMRYFWIGSSFDQNPAHLLQYGVALLQIHLDGLLIPKLVVLWVGESGRAWSATRSEPP